MTTPCAAVPSVVAALLVLRNSTSPAVVVASLVAVASSGNVKDNCKFDSVIDDAAIDWLVSGLGETACGDAVEDVDVVYDVFGEVSLDVGLGMGVGWRGGRGRGGRRRCRLLRYQGRCLLILVSGSLIGLINGVIVMFLWCSMSWCLRRVLRSRLCVRLLILISGSVLLRLVCLMLFISRRRAIGCWGR